MLTDPAFGQVPMNPLLLVPPHIPPVLEVFPSKDLQYRVATAERNICARNHKGNYLYVPIHTHRNHSICL